MEIALPASGLAQEEPCERSPTQNGRETISLAALVRQSSTSHGLALSAGMYDLFEETSVASFLDGTVPRKSFLALLGVGLTKCDELHALASAHVTPRDGLAPVQLNADADTEPSLALIAVDEPALNWEHEPVRTEPMDDPRIRRRAAAQQVLVSRPPSGDTDKDWDDFVVELPSPQRPGSSTHKAPRPAASSQLKQTTRMLKATCSCGYSVRLSRKWAEIGAPHCPNHGAMVVEGMRPRMPRTLDDDARRARRKVSGVEVGIMVRKQRRKSW